MSKHCAIVTGASSGLGLELTVALLAAGTKVVGVSRRAGTDKRWKSGVHQSLLMHVAGSVSKPQTVERAFAEADKSEGFDLVINCAGTGVFGPAGSYTLGDLLEVFDANLLGTILFSEAAFSRFRVRGGTIVNVMSTAAKVGRANEAVYCASKWGARGYTESLSLEAKSSQARVVAVYPGGMKTRFWSDIRKAQVDPAKFMDPAEVATAILDTIRARISSYVSDITIKRL
jgi:NAD(P)-dependent dehydrogenase (short-subunit alcohol dehydrogenase family)